MFRVWLPLHGQVWSCVVTCSVLFHLPRSQTSKGPEDRDYESPKERPGQLQNFGMKSTEKQDIMVSTIEPAVPLHFRLERSPSLVVVDRADQMLLDLDD